uniref:hypothetical protein n=1 Tax=Alistipes ihumii TaxID=1470347 RepID=UPI003FF12B4E
PFTMTIRCAQGVSFLRRKVDKLFIRPGQAVRRIDSFSAAESWTFRRKKYRREFFGKAREIRSVFRTAYRKPEYNNPPLSATRPIC